MIEKVPFSSIDFGTEQSVFVDALQVPKCAVRQLFSFLHFRFNSRGNRSTARNAESSE